GGGSSSLGKSVTSSPQASYGTGSAGGFTMAEILLSLTIIGVVAAITLPSLTGNINERTWNTQRKALYARFSQAIALMPALNGYGTLTGTIDASRSQTVTEDNVAETFITAGLSKVIKINNICDSTHLADCGINSTYTTLTGTPNKPMPTKMSELNPQMVSADNSTNAGPATYDALDTKAAALETQNGESIVLFYNPNCVANMGEMQNYFSQPKICVNMIYDLNGTKGPNTVGKDIGFMTILYPTDSVVVAPMPHRKTMAGVTSEAASSACTTSAGSDYRIPTKDELAALFVNKNLTEVGTTASHWFSSSKRISTAGKIKNWLIVAYNGHYRIPSDSSSEWEVLCVKRD
ncbi:MAG: type II secretion system GspH family protein, partial [Fusobacterium sp.]|nr:type II secretion system GspH family protein [Fusobacterium sp.]